MNTLYLRQQAEFAPDSASKKIKGIAYSGGVIKQHGPFENLVIDLSTTKIAKSKTPILRDHQTSLIAGQGQLSIKDNQLLLEGTLSDKTPVGKEIIDLAQDGFEWEMSVGIFDFDIQEVTNEEVNGIKLEKGVVFRNGVIREVSLLSLGADMDTKAEVFNYKKGEEMDEIKFSKEEYKKLLLACGCGGDMKPEKLAEEVEEKKKAHDEEVEELKKKIAELEAKLAEKEEEEKKREEEEKLSLRVKEIEDAAKEKKAEFSKEEIAEFAKTEETKKLALSIISKMTVKGQIDEKFAVKQNLDGTKPTDKKDPEALRLQAEKMVKDGEASSFIDAINKLMGI